MTAASDKQVRFVLGLLRQYGYSGRETVDPQIGRKWSLPQGDTLEETVKVLSSAECSALIDKLKGALE